MYFLLLIPVVSWEKSIEKVIFSHVHSQTREGKWPWTAVCWLVRTSLSWMFRVVKLMNWKHEKLYCGRLWSRKMNLLSQPGDPQSFTLRTTLGPSAPLTRRGCPPGGRTLRLWWIWIWLLSPQRRGTKYHVVLEARSADGRKVVSLLLGTGESSSEMICRLPSSKGMWTNGRGSSRRLVRWAGV